MYNGNPYVRASKRFSQICQLSQLGWKSHLMFLIMQILLASVYFLALCSVENINVFHVLYVFMLCNEFGNNKLHTTKVVVENNSHDP